MKAAGRVGMGLLVGALAFPAMVSGGKPAVTRLQLALKDLRHRSWTADDGLPNDRVFRITQSPEGYLWLSTERGLARFDGLRFTVPSPAPEGSEDYLIGAEADGVFWVTRYRQKQGELLQGKDGRLERFALPSSAQIMPLSMARAKDGALWLGGYFGGVVRLGREGAVRAFTAAEGIPPGDRVQAILQDQQGTMWLALARAGVLCLREGRFVPAGLPRPASAFALAEDRDGTVWAGTSDGIALFREGTARSLPGGGNMGAASALVQDHNGAMWIGTNGRGVFRYQAGVLENYDERRGLTNNVVRSLFTDKEGNVWVGTRSGLDRFSSAVFTTLTSGEGLPSNSFGPILRDRLGSLWMAPLTGGLFQLRQDILADVSPQLKNGRVLAMAESGRGGIWLAQDDGHVALFDNGKLKQWGPAEGLAPTEVDAVYEDWKGTLWIGQWGKGLLRMVNGRILPVAGQQKYPCQFIQAFAEGSAGEMWVADGLTGLLRFEADKVRLFGSAEGLPKGSAMGVYADAGGTVWSLVSGALSFFKDGRFERVRFRGGITMGDVGDIHEDGAGGFWIAGSGGIYRAERSELDAVRAGRAAEAGLAQYTRSDGLLGTSGTKYSHPIMTAGDGGTVWISSSRGLAIAEPKLARLIPPAPQVLMDLVQSDDRSFRTDRPVEFAPGTKKLQFTFTGVNLAAPEKVRFRYRLSGLEEKWSEPTSARSATYTNLGPKHYRFTVIAANGGGPWSQEVTADVTVLPHYYQTIWFHLAWVCAVGLLLWGAYWMRVRQMRERFDLVLNERSRIAREIHDTLLQGFAGIAWQLDTVSRRIVSQPRAGQQQLHALLGQMDECLAEARRAISGMRVRAAAHESWESQLELTGKQLAETAGISFSMERLGEPYELTPLGCESIFFVAKEAIRNAFRHSGAGRIHVAADYRRSELQVEVCDNGRGFAPRQEFLPGHWGIQGMRERMRLAGGTLEVESSAAGTRVTALLPHDSARRNGVRMGVVASPLPGSSEAERTNDD